MIAAKLIDVGVDQLRISTAGQLVAPVIRLFNLVTLTPFHAQPAKLYEFFTLFNILVEIVTFNGVDAAVKISGAFNMSFAELRGFIASYKLEVYCDHRPYADICESMTANPTIDACIVQHQNSFEARSKSFQIIPSRKLIRYEGCPSFTMFGPTNLQEDLCTGPISAPYYNVQSGMCKSGSQDVISQKGSVILTRILMMTSIGNIYMSSGEETSINHWVFDSENQYALPCELISNKSMIFSGSIRVAEGSILEAREAIAFQRKPLPATTDTITAPVPEELTVYGVDQAVLLSRRIQGRRQGSLDRFSA